MAAAAAAVAAVGLQGLLQEAEGRLEVEAEVVMTEMMDLIVDPKEETEVKVEATEVEVVMEVRTSTCKELNATNFI